MTQNFGRNVHEKYSMFTVYILTCSSCCMWEMPTRQFDVVPRKTKPTSYLAENSVASFERLEIESSFMLSDITFMIRNISIQAKLRYVFRVLFV